MLTTAPLTRTRFQRRAAFEEHATITLSSDDSEFNERRETLHLIEMPSPNDEWTPASAWAIPEVGNTYAKNTRPGIKGQIPNGYNITSKSLFDMATNYEYAGFTPEDELYY